jgi:RNA-splicing ligase RtcB
MAISDKVVPNLVGVDIGCGMETVVLKNNNVDFKQLDDAARRLIPSGFNVRNSPHAYVREIVFPSCNARIMPILTGPN